MTRSQRLRQQLEPPKTAIRVVTVAIIVLGLVALVWVFSPSERQRHADLETLQVGADTTQVLSVLGRASTRCPAGTLGHLEGSFPDGWAPAAVDVALERLRSGTAERWTYALDADEPARCDGQDEGHTEIGVGTDGRVLWYIAVTGRTPLQLPAELSPAGVTDPAGT